MRLDRELWLPEPEAQAAVLVRAVEETDRAGILLAPADRRRTALAAREASRRGPEVEKWLGPRAVAVVALLGKSVPSLPALLRATRLGRGLTAPALFLAALAGLASNALGPSQRIQVLALPLLGLIAWNLGSLLLLATRRWLLAFALPPQSPPRLLAALESLARRSLARYLPPAERSRGGERDEGPPDRRRSTHQALTKYLELWLPAVTPLAAARLRRALHAAALALVAGVVAGMYLRGLGLEYRVTWESTFLNERHVERFLGWILAPAAAVLDSEWPPQPLETIRNPPYGDAAPWIHLYAVTAALFVGVPRFLLVLVEGLRCRKLRRKLRLELPESYLRRLAAATAKEARRIDVLPYSHRPASQQLEALKKLLLDFFGPRSDVRLRPTLDYGAGLDDREELSSDGHVDCRVLLFPLSQTPEVEVHGELLERFKERFADGPALLVLVDGSSFRQRLGAAGDGAASPVAERLAERRRSWDRVLHEAGLEAVHLDLGEPVPDDVLNLLASAGWPAGALGYPA